MPAPRPGTARRARSPRGTRTERSAEQRHHHGDHNEEELITFDQAEHPPERVAGRSRPSAASTRRAGGQQPLGRGPRPGDGRRRRPGDAVAWASARVTSPSAPRRRRSRSRSASPRRRAARGCSPPSAGSGRTLRLVDRPVEHLVHQLGPLHRPDHARAVVLAGPVGGPPRQVGDPHATGRSPRAAGPSGPPGASGIRSMPEEVGRRVEEGLRVGDAGRRRRRCGGTHARSDRQKRSSPEA